MTKVKSKKEVIEKVHKEKKHFFCDAVDLCHLKNSELEQKFKKKGRCVRRGDVVKDVPGSYAVFTEQASDAVSAYTQVLLEDGPKMFETSQV